MIKWERFGEKLKMTNDNKQELMANGESKEEIAPIYTAKGIAQRDKARDYMLNKANEEAEEEEANKECPDCGNDTWRTVVDSTDDTYQYCKECGRMK